MLSPIFYSATLDSDCQQHFFLSHKNALNYLETQFRNQCVGDYDFDQELKQLYEENQIDNFGWVEEHRFEEYDNI